MGKENRSIIRKIVEIKKIISNNPAHCQSRRMIAATEMVE